MNENSLKALKENCFTPETAKKASEKAAEVRKSKAPVKSLAEISRDAMYTKAQIDVEAAKRIGKALNKPAKAITVADVAIYKQSIKAMAGDMNALCFLRDMLGEKPVDRISGKLTLDTDFDIVIEPEEEPEETDGE